MQVNHRLFKIIKIGFLALVLILAVYFFYINSFPNTPTYEGVTLDNPEDNYEDSPITNGYKIYTNSTIGVSFEYPAEWKMLIDQQDPVTHEFYAFLLTQDFSSNNSHPDISISKRYSGKAGDDPLVTTLYDNLPINEQIKALDCRRPECELVKNKKGVEYLRSPKIIQCDVDGCLLWSEVPTGKYILGFNMSIYDTPEKSSYLIDAYNHLIESIQLQ